MIVKSDVISNGSKEIIIPSNVSLLKIEVLDGSVGVKAKFERDSPYQAIGGIKMYDFSKITNITGQGIYNFDINGYYSVQLEYNGNSNLKYKLLN